MISVRSLVRLALILVAALGTVTLGARGFAPLPDLALLVVVAAALTAGPLGGASLGLLAGWIIDLMPPGGVLLGSSALMYAAAGALAGLGRREGSVPGIWFALVCAASSLVLEAFRVFLGLSSRAPIDWSASALRVLATVLTGAVLVPLLVAGEHWLTRRRIS
ncbi:MAG: hypothetical protein LWW86_16810 [Micrococcales bacterium]|nr:hypothetical protein [Micrococcales bacterium]